MNILALTSAYPEPDDNGVVVTPTVKYFCEEWAKAGHTVIVIHNNSCFPKFLYKIPKSIIKKMESKLGHTFPTRESRKKLCHTQADVKVYRFPMVKMIPHSKFTNRNIDVQIKKIEMALESEQFIPDVIISHWVNPQLDIMLGLKNIYQAKTSLIFHGDCSEDNVKKFDIKNKIKKVDAIGCRSTSYAKEVKERLGLPKLPFICYSGIPDDLVNNSERSIANKMSKHFVYVGRLVKYKNVDAIIRALNIAFPDKDFVLDIVGTGGELYNLKKLVEETNCEDKVRFHGQVSRQQGFEIMRQADCFTMISTNEVFGMVYIEAMAMGCITIASKNGGVDGVIVDGENGFLCEEGNAEELANIYKKIDVMTEDDKQRIRRNAKKTSMGFKDSVIADKYLNNVLEYTNA